MREWKTRLLVLALCGVLAAGTAAPALAQGGQPDEGVPEGEVQVELSEETGLQNLTASAGVPAAAFDAGRTTYFLLPWLEGSGEEDTAVLSATAWGTPTQVTFQVDGEESAVPSEGQEGTYPSEAYAVPNGTSRTVTVTLAYGGAEPLTHTAVLYRTHTRVEGKAAVSDGMLTAELWAYDGAFTGADLTLVYDPEALSVNEVDYFTAEDTGLTYDRAASGVDTNSGTVHLVLSGTATAGSDGLLLGRVSFAIKEEGPGVDQKSLIAGSGLLHVAEPEGYTGPVTYEGSLTVSGLPIAPAVSPETVAPRLASLTLEDTALKLMGGSGQTGFDPDSLTYTLALTDGVIPTMTLRAWEGTTVTVKAGQDGVPATITPESSLAQRTWSPEVADGTVLSITVVDDTSHAETVYTITVAIQAGMSAALDMDYVLGRDCCLAQLTLDGCTTQAVQMTLPLAGLTVTDAKGKALSLTDDVDEDGAVKAEKLSAFVPGGGLEVTKAMLSESELTLVLSVDGVADSGAPEVSFTGQAAAGVYLLPAAEAAMPNAVVTLRDMESGDQSRTIPLTDRRQGGVVTLNVSTFAPGRALSVACERWVDDAWKDEGELDDLLPLWSAEAENSGHWKGNGMGTGCYEQELRIPGVRQGQWRFTFRKTGHVPLCVTLTMQQSDRDLTGEIYTLPCGDLNGDERVTMEDYSLLAEQGSLGQPMDNSPLDLDGDGAISAADLALLAQPGNLGRGSETIVISD